jgi:hypothetical protein
VNWEPGGVAGRRPLAHPVARRLAEAMVGSRPVGVLLFQGAHGGLRAPADGTSSVVTRSARLLAQHTGRSTRPVLPVDRGGALIDWAQAALGTYALEVAPWGPGHRPRPAPTDGEHYDLIGETGFELRRAHGPLGWMMNGAA